VSDSEFGFLTIFLFFKHSLIKRILNLTIDESSLDQIPFGVRVWHGRTLSKHHKAS